MMIIQYLTFNYNTIFVIYSYISIVQRWKVVKRGKNKLLFKSEWRLSHLFLHRVTWVIFRCSFPRNHGTDLKLRKLPAKQLLLLYCTEMMNHYSHLFCYQAFVTLQRVPKY